MSSTKTASTETTSTRSRLKSHDQALSGVLLALLAALALQGVKLSFIYKSTLLLVLYSRVPMLNVVFDFLGGFV